ncbi:MAG: hypothetical protein AAF678_12365 [Pseudomonadota bacterium]
MSKKKFDKEFDKLMKTVKILRKHFSEIYGEIEEELVRLRFKKDKRNFDKLNRIRRKMRSDYDESLGLIGAQITSIEQLTQSRNLLRGAADEAFKFVKQMRKIKKTIDDFAKAAGFLSGVLKGLKGIVS